MLRPIVIGLFLLAQTACTLFFSYDIFAALLNLPYTPLPWELREVLELAAALGLLVGLVLGVILLRQAVEARKSAEKRLRRASAAFAELLAERFADWRLTQAEREVALLVIKGFAPAEIAQIRKSAEGTVKAQCNAIYRKAGVEGRFHLVGLFIEDLMHDLPEGPAQAPLPDQQR